MTTPPQARLADALSGEVTGPSAIQVGDHTLACYPTGLVYLLPERQKLGSWRDETGELVAAFRAAVAS